MKKKLIITLIACSLAFSMTACSAPDEASQTKAPSQSAESSSDESKEESQQDTTAPESENASGINEEKFNQIKNGMTYDEVKEIIGVDGTNISESELGGIKTVMYQWTVENGIGNVTITFQDDKVINKTQIGVSEGSDVTVTAEMYEKISTGMTYDEVKEIFGGDGALISDSEIAGSSSQMYQWDGSSLGANCTISFSDGKVTAKSQIGLE